MPDNDLIRRGDALAALQAAYDDSGFEPDLADADARIAALPAVTPAPDARAIREAALRAAADAVEDYCADMPDLAGHGHSVGLKDAILALIPKGGNGRRVYMGQIMAECDCPREAECQAAGRCIAEGRKWKLAFAHAQDVASSALSDVATASAALHRSFPEAGDGRPLPPMGDELMSAGLSAEDARFVAVQLAQNGYTLTKRED